MAVLTSNQFCFPASASNWLNRRMILIECNNVLPKRDRDPKLLEKMREELPVFTSYLLWEAKEKQANKCRKFHYLIKCDSQAITL